MIELSFSTSAMQISNKTAVVGCWIKRLFLTRQVKAQMYGIAIHNKLTRGMLIEGGVNQNSLLHSLQMEMMIQASHFMMIADIIMEFLLIVGIEIDLTE
jgi:hypothetical protein